MIDPIKKIFNIFAHTQFAKFLVVGTVGMIINLGSLYFLVEFLDLYYMIGATISFILSITHNFFFNKIWSFRNKKSEYKKQYGQYLLISILSMLIGLGLLNLIVELLGIWYFFAQIFAVMIAGINSFLWVKFWVFKE
tara:strand:+ start:224 stop:634 length:411 start_codon:yes stop_codon:yes gene_type:complete